MKPFDVKCTSCGSPRVSASPHESRWGTILSLLSLNRLRCTFCGRRFYRFVRQREQSLGLQNPLVTVDTTSEHDEQFQRLVQDIARIESQMRPNVQAIEEREMGGIGRPDLQRRVGFDKR